MNHANNADLPMGRRSTTTDTPTASSAKTTLRPAGKKILTTTGKDLANYMEGKSTPSQGEIFKIFLSED